MNYLYDLILFRIFSFSKSCNFYLLLICYRVPGTRLGANGIGGVVQSFAYIICQSKKIHVLWQQKNAFCKCYALYVAVKLNYTYLGRIQYIHTYALLTFNVGLKCEKIRSSERLRNLAPDPFQSHQNLTYCTYLITISHYYR